VQQPYPTILLAAIRDDYTIFPTLREPLNGALAFTADALGTMSFKGSYYHFSSWSLSSEANN
jgi:hypothetical protein